MFRISLRFNFLTVLTSLLNRNTRCPKNNTNVAHYNLDATD